MALVRILIDGYSLLHSCPQIGPGLPRHSAAARDELAVWLGHYRDATGIPITLFFDGSGRVGPPPESHSSRDLEILYSQNGQTADEMIERVAHRLVTYGEVMVVTDDSAERDTVIGFGSLACDCRNFFRTVEAALKDLQQDLTRYNRQELRRYNQAVHQKPAKPKHPVRERPC